MSVDELKKYIKKLDKEMKREASDLNFERAVILRDEIIKLKQMLDE